MDKMLEEAANLFGDLEKIIEEKHGAKKLAELLYMRADAAAERAMKEKANE